MRAAPLLLLLLLVWGRLVAAEERPCSCTEDATSGAVCLGQDCSRPPPLRATSLHVLRTATEELRRDAFRHLPQLLSLRIENNQRLTQIRGGAFRGLPQLQFLSVSFTGRLQLAASAFVGLRNLTRLRLVKTGLTKVADATPALAPHFLPTLLSLDLSENVLTTVEARDFAPMAESPLQELTLALCQTEFVHEDALAPLRSLRGLYLGHNMLNASTLTRLVAGVVRNALPLTVLDLQDMSFQRQPPQELMAAVGRTNVTHLLLKNNQFPTLPAGSFPEMPNLEFLDLREVSALFVDDRAFDPALVPRLKVLLLGGNKLTSVGPGILLPQLESLDVSGNKEDRRLQPDFTVVGGNFAAMRQLKYLNLSMNRINYVGADMFAGLHGLDEQLCLNDAHLTKVEDGAFRDLANLKFLSLANNPLGDANLTAETFSGLTSLEVLLLDRCGLTHLAAEPSVFLYLASLQYLSLSYNDVHTVGDAVFSSLPSLVGVDLSHNLLESWKERTLFGANVNLSTLLLSQNKLTYLTPAMLRDFATPTRVELDGNPFNCYPPLYSAAKEWLGSHNTSLQNLTAIVTPVCYSPDAWKNRNLTDFLELLDDGEDGVSLVVVVGVAVSVLLLLAVLAGLAYVYRAYIRYWIFLARMDIGRRLSRVHGHGDGEKKRRLEGYVNYQYDAFVSYSSEDRNFVVRLVAMLENYEPFLKLCVYERDFEIGSAISEAVLESVALSRHSLLVVRLPRETLCRQ